MLCAVVDPIFLVIAAVLVVAAWLLAIYSCSAWGLLALLIRNERLRDTGGPQGRVPPATTATFRPCGSPSSSSDAETLQEQYLRLTDDTLEVLPDGSWIIRRGRGKSALPGHLSPTCAMPHLKDAPAHNLDWVLSWLEDRL